MGAMTHLSSLVVTDHGCLVVIEYENSTCILGVQCHLQLVTELLYHRTLNLRTVYQHLFQKNCDTGMRHFRIVRGTHLASDVHRALETWSVGLGN